jgi:Holliday junction resolvasome RuvABC ATP-dependent DNA helicase subunit
VKILKTWHLKTSDGRAVYQDFRGNATLEEGPNIPFVFIEGEQAHGKQALADVVASELGTECVWEPGPDWTQ